MKRGLLSLLVLSCVCLVGFLGGCGGSSGGSGGGALPATATSTSPSPSVSPSTSPTPSTARLVLIRVLPATTTVALGAGVQFQALGTFSDGSVADLTAKVIWSASGASVTVSSSGFGTAQAAGIGVITATQNGVSGTAAMTVTAASLTSITVTPANSSLPQGRSRRFVATGTYSDGDTADITRSVTWTSSSSGVATIDATSGLATAQSAGTATITATSGGVKGTTNLTVTAATLVSIAVTPAAPQVPIGTVQQFTAVGTFSDGGSLDLTDSTSLTWSSASPSVASISSAGLATARSAGATVITASDSGVTGTTRLTVAATSLTSLTVTPSNPTTVPGTPVAFKATGTFSNGSTADVTTSVVWTSSATTVASISTTGVATPVGAGKTTITATDFSTQTLVATTTLTVSAASVTSLSLIPSGTPALSLTANQQGQFTAIALLSDKTTSDVTAATSWTSTAGATIATVGSARPGLVTAGSAPTSGIVISASFGGKNATATMAVVAKTLQSISVYSTNNQIVNGGTLQYTATGYSTDNTTVDLTNGAVWASSDPVNVAVTQAGKVTASTATSETVVISATSGGVVGQLVLQVNPPAQPQNTVTMKVVNNSGIPDAAVYLTSHGVDSNSNANYNAFCSTPLVVPYPSGLPTASPTPVGTQYSFPLTAMTAAGSHTYTFQCPTRVWGSTIFNMSLGGPLIIGLNSAGALVTPAVGGSTPFNLIEPNFNADGLGDGNTLFIDISCVDQFSVPVQFDLSGVTPAPSPIGFPPTARATVLQSLNSDPVFGQLVNRTNFTTVSALSVGKFLSNQSNTAPLLAASLNNGIDAAWKPQAQGGYAGVNNTNVNWTYGAFTYTGASTGDPNAINIVVGNDVGSPYTISFPKPSSSDIVDGAFNQPGNEIYNGLPPFTGNAGAGALNIQAIIAASLQRGVFSNYAQWGSPAAGNPPTPQFYYVNEPFSHYAKYVHASALQMLMYAFSSDDHYSTDAAFQFNVAGATLTITVQPFDLSR